MKKYIALLLCAVLALPMMLLPGAAHAEGETLRVVSTIFPPYDFVRNIAGESVSLTMLLPPGSESHSFEPSPRDILTIQEADVFLYIGGETDAWVDRILASMDTTGMTILALTDLVETSAEEIVPGMQHDHADHAHEEAFDPDKVADRPLSDWDGAWQSLYPMAEAGDLDAYVQAQAEEQGIAMDEAAQAQLAKWRTDYDALTVQDGAVSLPDGRSAAYAYRGYSITEGDHPSVWYRYERVDADADDALPRHLMLNDHGTGGDHDHEDHADEAHDDHEAHADALAHTHLRYGNDGFDALLEAEGWSPFYVASGATADEVIATLTGHSHSHGEDAEMDEHVWTSPKNAMRIVTALENTLSSLDPERAATYAENAAAYQQRLAALDGAFEQAVSGAARRTVLFGDRFPFRYLADAYGLAYYAAFPGCATETEASAQTVAFLIDQVRAEGIPAVFSIEFSNGKIADAIAEETGAKRLTMHSCHNVSKQEFDEGIGYIELMEANVTALKEALS